MKLQQYLQSIQTFLICFFLLIPFTIISCNNGDTTNGTIASDDSPADTLNKVSRINIHGCTECISTGCLSEASCNSYSCQIEIRQCHSITELELIGMIETYTRGQIPLPKIISKDTINKYLNMANCSPVKLTFDAPLENEITHNNDIILYLEDLKKYAEKNNLSPITPDDSLKFIGKASYSQALFKGIMQLGPDEFHFYKAIGTKFERDASGNCIATPKFDIVFSAVDAEGNVLYYGDVSDLFP